MSTHLEKNSTNSNLQAETPVNYRAKIHEEQLYHTIDELLQGNRITDLTSFLSRAFQSHITLDKLPRQPHKIIREEPPIEGDAEDFADLMTFLVNLDVKWRNFQQFSLPLKLENATHNEEE